MEDNLFITLLELQGLIQAYNAYKQILYHHTRKHGIDDGTRKEFYFECRKMDIFLVNIKLKKETLGIEKSVDDLLEEEIPLIDSLLSYPRYIEFLRTNNSSIDKVTFKIDSKRSCESAFGRSYCKSRNPTQYI